MSSWRDLYPGSGSSVVTLYPRSAVVDAVPLREDFNSLIDGSPGEIPIGQAMLLRRLRKVGGEKVPCSCLDATTKEPDIDFPCPICWGVGYLWDEELTTGYKMTAASPTSGNAEVNLAKHKTGLVYVPSVKLYLKYDLSPALGDQVVELQLDAEGEVVRPYVRIVTYELNLIRAFRGDNGRIEFWACDGQTIAPRTVGHIG